MTTTAQTTADTDASAHAGAADARADAVERRCIASGQTLPVTAMVRFVVGPEGAVVPDVDHRLPGKGLWLSADRDMVETAVSKRLFGKAARSNVTVPANLADTVADLLRRRCLNHLGLARRAGLVTAGGEKVRAQLAAGRVAVLLEAADGSAPERRKFTALAPDAPVVDAFTSVELGGALGRDAVTHVALAEGRLTRTIVADAARYVGLKPGAKADERKRVTPSPT
jgi:predicted RNA-binding protein YlxR (DUF448 family)